MPVIPKRNVNSLVMGLDCHKWANRWKERGKVIAEAKPCGN
jgi:hypothetical protein